MAEVGAPVDVTPDLILGLSVVIVAVEGDAPRVLLTRVGADGLGLPFGAFDPGEHRTFELALRRWVADQTGFELGFVEQLYTFGDQGRELPRAILAEADAGARVVSVGYLALTGAATDVRGFPAVWQDWYGLFPWEDWRHGRPACMAAIATGLRRWAEEQPLRLAALDRARLTFGLDGRPWIEERVLERYELLYEAGLVAEAGRDAGAPLREASVAPGAALISDHRRILATAVGRLRGKIKYRPVLFELVEDVFTLSALQRTAEAVLGIGLHKQNFRRALEASGLVEGTGLRETATGGRPAELFRFRRELLSQRPVLGVPTPVRQTGPK
jgi:hypothetical protein